MKSVNLLFLLTEAAVHRKNKLKISVLKNFAIFPRKHRYWNLFLIKTYNFIKKILQHRLFPLNIAKFLRAHILKNICEQQFCVFFISLPLRFLFFFFVEGSCHILAERSWMGWIHLKNKLQTSCCWHFWEFSRTFFSGRIQNPIKLLKCNFL